ncbi:MAG: YybH family protein [Gemmatimonadota bacterium]
MKKHLRWTLLPLALLAGACQAADDAAEVAAETEAASALAADEAALDELRAYYAEHFNLGHASMVAELYTDTAVTLFADGSVNLGRAEIEAGLTEIIAGSPAITITREAVHVADDAAVARGAWTMETPVEGAEPAASSGHYLTVFTRGDSGWKIQAVVSNYDTEVPAEALTGVISENVDDEEDDGTIALVTAYEEAWAAGDTEALSMMWTEDAHAAFSMSPAIEGRPAIAERLAEVVAGTIDIHPKATLPMGDGYAAIGGWYQVDTDEGSTTGTYLSLVRATDDGSHQLHWGVSNGRPSPAE